MCLDNRGDNISSAVPNQRHSATAEVARQLRDLAERLEADCEIAEKSAFGFGLNEKAGRTDYLLKVRAIISERVARRQIFGTAFVDDPAWAILLDLFEAYHAQRSRCVKSACIASGVPATTALRHLAIMENEGLLFRRADLCDKRRTLIGLTELALSKLRRYFDNL